MRLACYRRESSEKGIWITPCPSVILEDEDYGLKSRIPLDNLGEGPRKSILLLVFSPEFHFLLFTFGRYRNLVFG